MPAPERSSAMTSDRRSRYLNGILTVNAVMLAALVWTNIAGTSASSLASAAPQSTGKPGDVDTFPNASAQRQTIIGELKSLRSDLARLESNVMGGKMKVIIGNPDDIKLDIDYGKLKSVLKD